MLFRLRVSGACRRACSHVSGQLCCFASCCALCLFVSETVAQVRSGASALGPWLPGCSSLEGGPLGSVAPSSGAHPVLFSTLVCALGKGLEGALAAFAEDTGVGGTGDNVDDGTRVEHDLERAECGWKVVKYTGRHCWACAWLLLPPRPPSLSPPAPPAPLGSSLPAPPPLVPVLASPTTCMCTDGVQQFMCKD